MRYLVRCSCGRGWLPADLPMNRWPAVLRARVADMVAHWRRGDRLLASRLVRPLLVGVAGAYSARVEGEGAA